MKGAMAGEIVLVIDDSPTILKVVQLVLTKEGYNVVTASDGDEGIEVAKATRPQVILLDFVMPKMNGYQVCRALHQEEEHRHHAGREQLRLYEDREQQHQEDHQQHEHRQDRQQLSNGPVHTHERQHS